MKNKILIHCSVLISLLVTGCLTTVDYNKTLQDATLAHLEANFESYSGKLTTSKLLMFAFLPAARIDVDDGTIWIYTYRKLGSKNTTKTTTGNGSLFNPKKSQAITSPATEHYFDVQLHFNKSNVLYKWRFDGNCRAFDTPFHHSRLVDGQIQYTPLQLPKSDRKNQD